MEKCKLYLDPQSGFRLFLPNGQEIPGIIDATLGTRFLSSHTGYHQLPQDQMTITLEIVIISCAPNNTII